MMTSAGAVLFSITVVFANTMITNGPHPSYMDPVFPQSYLKPQLTDPSTDYATALVVDRG
jgi:hypothetical protein